MNTTEFRKELVKIMPGYEWTVHRPFPDIDGYFSATGAQSSGFNRTSTLQVTRTERKGLIEYEVKSSGYGKRAPWLATSADTTLARALRSLQNHYEDMAQRYASHASALKEARKPKTDNSQAMSGTVPHNN